MNWIDAVDDLLARKSDLGQAAPRVLTREEYAAMPPGERQAAGATAVRGVLYLGDGDHVWLRIGRVDLHAPEDRWTLWDHRDPRAPTPLCTGIPDLRLAMSLGNLAATSRATRLVLSGLTIAQAAVVAMADAWARERRRVA